MRGVFDVEANGLLDHTTIDYRAAPFKLKPIFRVWCAVIIDIDTGRVYRFAGEEEMRTGFVPLFKKLKTVIGHNIIDYDLLVLKLYFGIDYEIADQCTIDGQPVEIVDTLVWSKALNPDRYGGHSLDEWGKRLGLEKIDWRQRAVDLGLIPWNAPRGAEFAQYHPEMLDYNERDCHVNVKLYWALLEEVGEWDWSDTFTLEQCVRDIVTRGSHRGFWFDQELAQANVRDLDEKMESIRQTVEPLLPEKPMGVTKLKAFLPPKIQFLKNGNPSSHMQKFAEKHGGTLEQVDGKWVANIFGKVWSLPMAADVPVKTHEPATVKDTTHIKGWLVEMGWRPTQYKERDLTCDSKKKKLSPEKFAETVERYVEQTINSPFCRDRCEELNTVPSRLREKLLKHDLKRPLKVYTNPTITVGMEKEIDPALLELADKFPHAKLVSEYLTYAHRRNSILGGGVDPDELEDDDEFAGKGFLAAERIAEDGRIPTPADSCGAGTSRFKHRLVANIPRVTSLYGKNMRAQFGVDVEDGFVQLGYDFDSLEAKIEAHYVYRYKGGPEYGVSLTAEKPNDCHSVLARMISEILGREFPRSTAKNVKYGCSYNAQPPRVAKTIGCSLEDAQTIFDTFWTQAAPLKELKEKMQQYWETTGQKKFLKGLDNRKLPIRSKGNVINTAFQSAGVICAKRAMVLHDRKLKAEGMAVDFFRDNWKEKEFCQQLIAYHDEAQLEVKRSLVKFKTFPVSVWQTKNEETGKMEDSKEAKDAKAAASAFKAAEEEATGKRWSDVMKGPKGYFVGYCRAGELATEAVVEAGRYYKLNVELSAGYMLGRNWAECH